MKDQINKLLAMPCYCGHDCSKCVTYIATQSNDDDLRRQSQTFYRERLGIDIPLEKFNCGGGKSKNVFELCMDCLFFASTFWKKLQNIFGECCISKLEKVARLRLADSADRIAIADYI